MGTATMTCSLAAPGTTLAPQRRQMSAEYICILVQPLAWIFRRVGYLLVLKLARLSAQARWELGILTETATMISLLAPIAGTGKRQMKAGSTFFMVQPLARQLFLIGQLNPTRSPAILVCLLALLEMSTEMVTPICWSERTSMTMAPPMKARLLPGTARKLALEKQVIRLMRIGWPIATRPCVISRHSWEVPAM